MSKTAIRSEDYGRFNVRMYSDKDTYTSFWCIIRSDNKTKTRLGETQYFSLAEAEADFSLICDVLSDTLAILHHACL